MRVERARETDSSHKAIASLPGEREVCLIAGAQSTREAWWRKAQQRFVLTDQEGPYRALMTSGQERKRCPAPLCFLRSL